MKRNPNFNCIICGKGKYCPPSRIKIGHGKYCSKCCMGIAKKGKKDKNLTYKYPKGHISWNKGFNRAKANCLNCKKEIYIFIKYETKYCSKKCHYQHVRLDFDGLSYTAKHQRMRDKYGKPMKCEYCGTNNSPKFEWANISGEYKEDKNDWIRLCCTCHRRYDLGTKNKIYI